MNKIERAADRLGDDAAALANAIGLVSVLNAGKGPLTMTDVALLSVRRNLQHALDDIERCLERRQTERRAAA